MATTNENVNIHPATHVKCHILDEIKFGYQKLQSMRYTVACGWWRKPPHKNVLLIVVSLTIGYSIILAFIVSITAIDLNDKSRRIQFSEGEKNNESQIKIHEILIHILFTVCYLRYTLRALLHVTCNLYICTPPIYLVQFSESLCFSFSKH